LLPGSKLQQLCFVGIHLQPVAAHPGINTLNAQDEALHSG